jgi:hypothetical protein
VVLFDEAEIVEIIDHQALCFAQADDVSPSQFKRSRRAPLPR